MYLEHFGIAQYPFSLTPNTRFFLKLPTHQEAFDALVRILQLNGDVAKITGEVGTGKTMLCRKVLNALDLHRDKFVTAYIPHPIQSEEGIMHAIADELSIEHPPDLSYYELLRVITAQLKVLARDSKRVVLFVDETQAMPEETLKAVFLLTEVALDGNKHLQLILFGQPELDELLAQPALKPLRDKLDLSFELPALDEDGAQAYVLHRLNRAGYSGPGLFTGRAMTRLFEASRGIPRLINILCHKALMVAYGKGERQVDIAHMDSAIADTEASFGKKNLSSRFFSR